MKINSIPINKKCNCMKPLYLSEINGINPQTGREYTEEDKQIIKSSLYRMSNARGCSLGTCCDPKASYENIDTEFFGKVTSKYSHYQLIKKNGIIDSILLWDITIKPEGPIITSPKDDNNSKNNKNNINDWKLMEPYIVCKISKAEIVDGNEPHIKIAKKIMSDCYLDSCDNIEQITLQNVLTNEKNQLNSTYFDDMQVVDAIKDNNIEYLKNYIRTYGMIDQALTNDSMNNRLLHLIAQYGNNQLMDLILALKPDINISNIDGDTPLHFAARSNNFDNVEKLINQGAELNLLNLNKETPANMAIQAGNMAMLRLLYNNGSGILGTDINGNNFIHYTILNAPENEDKVKIIRFLLNNGVNSESLNNQKKTPLELTKIKIDKLEHENYVGYSKEEIKNNKINKYGDILDEKEDISNNISNNINNNISIENFENIEKSLIETLFSWFTNDNKTNNKNNSNKNMNIVKNNNKKQKLKEIESKHIPQIPIKKQNPEITEMTLEMRNLLEIQTILFNNIISNNPEKYQSNYFNIAELPKGSPIEALYDVCAGPGLTGEEDSVTCLANGGHMVKIKNPTTRIKLDLIQSDDIKSIENIKDSELMMPKYSENREVPEPDIISDYNKMVRNEVNNINNINLNQSKNIIKEEIEQHPNLIKDDEPSVILSRNKAINNSVQLNDNNKIENIEGFTNNICYRNLLILLLIIILIIILFYIIK